MIRLFEEARWDVNHVRGAGWNPLAEVIRPGDTVVVKPNWVFHENHSGQGIDCVVTHVSVVDALLDLVLRAKAGKVVVGDAPIQDCDLPTLMEVAGYNSLKQQYRQASTPVVWRDFRGTGPANAEAVWDQKTSCRSLGDYVVLDLGEDSLLEPIAQGAHRFRAWYDTDLIRQRHACGRHQYLIAREVMDADVIISLPKLKTHRKVCVTAALKNVVGMTGEKDSLPHHCRGGTRTGGDCFNGGNPFKLVAEYFLEAAMKRQEGGATYVLRRFSRASHILARLTGADKNLEGNWYGNDTIWRTCLDLNRILLYGRPDGTMAEQPQRRVLTVTDAIVCGEGEGPLRPARHVLGMLSLATNPVAADYVHAHLMGFDWRKIPLIREAFGKFRYPVCSFSPTDIEVHLEGHRLGWPWRAGSTSERPFVPPAGWKGHCER
jgi:uncharacterized protein (DUF362 family)